MESEKLPWWTGAPMLPPLLEDHSDERGRLCILTTPETFRHAIGAVGVMFTRAGEVRAEHRHAKDAHVCVLLTGWMRYHVRDADGVVTTYDIQPLRPFFTPPGLDHAFEYLLDSWTVFVSAEYRSSEAYEADLMRLEPRNRIVKR